MFVQRTVVLRHVGLQDDGGPLHHPEHHAVDVVLQVRHLLALALHRPLQETHHLYQVLNKEHYVYNGRHYDDDEYTK